MEALRAFERLDLVIIPSLFRSQTSLNQLMTGKRSHAFAKSGGERRNVIRGSARYTNVQWAASNGVE